MTMSATNRPVSRDGLLLVSRILISLLFVTFGWGKLGGYDATTGYFAQLGVPLPAFATAAAICMELIVGAALIFGLWTRPLAIVLALYTIVTALVGHHFWTLAGADRFESSINFYKNISIVAGLLLLYVSGPGRYSIDGRFSAR
jgi:putative oxidoreductase